MCERAISESSITNKCGLELVLELFLGNISLVGGGRIGHFAGLRLGGLRWGSSTESPVDERTMVEYIKVTA